ncbi:MAG: response regulator transcription factor [Methylomicrobium sp.]
MIIDDTPGNLALLSDLLSEAGYRVLVAIDGLSALEQIELMKPDIILLDVVMPGIDGFETCRKLKGNPATDDIPVLFMTGLSELDKLLQGFEEGGVDYLVKPINPPEVLARIEVHLNQARTLRRAEHALLHAQFAALTVDTTGRITWLTPMAKNLLSDAKILGQSEDNIAIGAVAPKEIRDCLSARIHSGDVYEHSLSEQNLMLDDLSLKISHCLNSGEFLILLQKRGDERDWNLDSLRTTLGLTLREAEILMWISRGKTNKEVGLILGSSPRTVNKHLERDAQL